jgi:ATP-dependent DNA helicase RecQ
MLHTEALQTLRSVFGYEAFKGHQEAIIQHICQGGDALVLMPTAAGKSLCYQLPALLLEGVGIVISPLIALMQDQVSALHQLGINAAFLNSTLTLEQVQTTENALLKGEIDLLYIAPERLVTAHTQWLLSQLKICLFAIDEAHCVSHWGHDFRADYLQLSILSQRFPNVPRIALTATADPRTRDEIINRLSLGSAKQFISSFDRPNIRYRIIEKQQSRQQLLSFIKHEHPKDSGIVYCLSRRKVEETTAWLVQQGFKALCYHAGLSHELRQHNQHQFLMEDSIIIVATIAFGMGIDKPNVRFVAHLDLPKSIEAYYQETGRAGRDGLPANAWLSYGLHDVMTLKQILASSNADEQHKRIELAKLDAMLALCETVHCRRQLLLNYFGEQREQACGNCDTCLQEVATWDGSLAAQQALSAIYRCGQRFGVIYLIAVLLGKTDERIQQNGHHLLAIFGIGQKLSEHQWRSVFRQLIARGLVVMDMERHGALRLDVSCRPVLRGEQSLILRQDNKASKNKVQRTQKLQNLADQDSELWEALRTKRRQLAEQQDVPPYIIFNDLTLYEMIEKRPTSSRQFANLTGVGERKLALYGDEFLSVIADFT